jgi:hypothetical protein
MGLRHKSMLTSISTGDVEAGPDHIDGAQKTIVGIDD